METLCLSYGFNREYWKFVQSRGAREQLRPSLLGLISAQNLVKCILIWPVVIKGTIPNNLQYEALYPQTLVCFQTVVCPSSQFNLEDKNTKTHNELISLTAITSVDKA